MKLKPCPFCGDEAELRESFGYYVTCTACLSGSDVYDTEIEAIKAWNNRSTKQIIELLDELIETSEYWSEYDVPLGLHDRIKQARELLK